MLDQHINNRANGTERRNPKKDPHAGGRPIGFLKDALDPIVHGHLGNETRPVGRNRAGEDETGSTPGREQ